MILSMLSMVQGSAATMSESCAQLCINAASIIIINWVQFIYLNTNHIQNHLQSQRMADSLNLSSKTLLKTSSISSNCMCVLYDNKKMARIFIAHEKGVLQYDPSTSKFQHMKLNESGLITCLTASDDELVFFCSGVKIVAVGLNGRVAYESQTFLAVDHIDSIHVHGYRVWLVAGGIISEFLIGGVGLSNKKSRITPSPAKSIEDVSSQMFDTKINNSLLIRIDGQKPFLLLLMANSQIISFQKKEEASFKVESPPTCGEIYPLKQQNVGFASVLIGCANGSIILLSASRKKLQKMWQVPSAGRITCLLELTRGFMLMRDKTLQMWSADKEMMGNEEIEEKIMSAVFLPEDERIVYGTAGGRIVEMINYQKMIKLSKQRNEVKEKEAILKQIQQLKKQKADLTFRWSSASKSNTVNPAIPKINCALSLDFSKLCYTLDVTSDKPIFRINLKGSIEILSGGECFATQEKESKMWIVLVQNKKSLQIQIKYEQKYHENEKISAVIFTMEEAGMLASCAAIDPKHLSLHQKIAPSLFTCKECHTLRISGEFKAFMAHFWLSTIFNDFGPAPQDDNPVICYENIVSKRKIRVRYGEKNINIECQSAAALAIIRKVVGRRAKEKQLSLNYQAKTNSKAIQAFFNGMESKLQLFIKNKKEFDLLPALLELSADSISPALKSIINRSAEIKQLHSRSEREVIQFNHAIQFEVVGYRLINGKQDKENMNDEVKDAVEKADIKKLVYLCELS